MFITQFSTVVVMNTLCDAFPSWIFCHFLLSSFSPSILLAYQFLANLASFDCPPVPPIIWGTHRLPREAASWSPPSVDPAANE